MKAITTIKVKDMHLFFSRAYAGLYAAAGRLWSVLSLSAADERIAPGKDLCIAVERSVISAAYGTKFLSGIRIRGVKQYRPEERGYPQPRDLASAAVLAVRELGAAGANVTLSLPKAWVIIRTAEFPSVVRENLPDVVACEFDRLMPFSPDEALYDFAVLGESSGKVTLALAAARADLVNSYLDALRDEGIPVGRVTINLSGIGSLCRFMGNEESTPLFIEVREDGYEGALYLGGSPALVMSGSFGSPDERARVDAILADSAPLLGAAKDRGITPSIVALFRDKTAGLREMFRAKAGFPVAFLGESDIKLRLPGKQSGIPYAALGGVLESLRPNEKRPDLLAKGRQKGKKTPLGLSAALVLVFIALWVLSLLIPLRIEEEKLGELDRRIALRKAGVKDVETLRKEADAVSAEIATVEDFKGKKPLAVAVLKELTNILPKTVWLTRARVAGAAVEIEGYASSATELLPRLEASKLFGRAEFASPTFRDSKMNADRFSIKMELKGSKDTEGAKSHNAKK